MTPPSEHESRAQISALSHWPSVSVIVPVYNGASVLEACLNALFSQDYPGPAPELIIVNNNSTDDTATILERYRDRIVICNEPEQGSSPARNSGILRATHDLIAFTDADCVPRPDWLRELVTVAQADPWASFVGGAIRALRPTNVIGEFAESLFDHQKAIQESKPPYIITANLMARRSDLFRFGLFNSAFPRGQDTELAWRAYFFHGARFTFAEHAIVDHVNSASLGELLHKGIQHGRGSARLWRDFQTQLGSSPKDRIRQSKPFRDAWREAVALIPNPWRPRKSNHADPRRLHPFYAAYFRLARHLSFIYYTLRPGA